MAELEELEPTIVCEGTARIRHIDTRELFEISSEELSWNLVSEDERPLGKERHYEAIVDHRELGELVWVVTEYPVGAAPTVELDSNGHSVEEDFSIAFEHGTEFQEALDYEAQELVDWFFERYEDPANSLPYITREGGYQWIEGGPHDARDALQDAFEDTNPVVLDRAVEVIERGGQTEWAMQLHHLEGLYPEDESADEIEENVGEFDEVALPEDSSDIFTVPDEVEDGETNQVELPNIPPQEAGLQFRLSEDQRIEIVERPEMAKNSDLGNSLRAECLDAAEELLKVLAGTNAYSKLRDKLESYLVVLSEPEVNAAGLFARGVRLQNAHHQLITDVALGELPEPSAEIKEGIKSVLDLHGALIMESSAGRTLVENAKQYAWKDSQTKEYQKVAHEVTTAVSNAKDLFEQSAVDEIAAINDEAGSGPFPNMSDAVSVSTFTNLIKFIARPIVQLAKNPAVKHLSLAGLGVSAAGSGIAAELGSFLDAGLGFLVSNISIIKNFAPFAVGDTGWMAALVKFLESL